MQESCGHFHGPFRFGHVQLKPRGYVRIDPWVRGVCVSGIVSEGLSYYLCVCCKVFCVVHVVCARIVSG